MTDETNNLLNETESESKQQNTNHLKFIIHPSIHCSMGSAPVGAQCPLTSSLGEFLGYWAGCGILGFRPCWRPSPFPSPSISQCFLFTFLYLPLDFIRLFFMVAVSASHHQLTLFQTKEWHYGNWISEMVEIPWWWSFYPPLPECGGYKIWKPIYNIGFHSYIYNVYN